MKPHFLAVGLLAGMGAYVHLTKGGNFVLKPMLKNETVNEKSKLLLSSCWHLVTTMLLSSAVSATLIGSEVLSADSQVQAIAQDVLECSSKALIGSAVTLLTVVGSHDLKNCVKFPQGPLMAVIGGWGLFALRHK